MNTITSAFTIKFVGYDPADHETYKNFYIQFSNIFLAFVLHASHEYMQFSSQPIAFLHLAHERDREGNNSNPFDFTDWLLVRGK